MWQPRYGKIIFDRDLVIAEFDNGDGPMSRGLEEPDAFYNELASVIAGQKNPCLLIVDLTAREFINSGSLGAIIRVRDFLEDRHQGQMYVCGALEWLPKILARSPIECPRIVKTRKKAAAMLRAGS